MKSTFSILFYLKRGSQKQNGNIPVMGRITVNGKSTQFSAKVEIHPDLWNVKAGKAIGKGKDVHEVNMVTESIKASMTKIYRDLQERESFVTPEKIKNIFFGLEVENHTLLTLFTKHNEDFLKLVDSCNKAKVTYWKYERTKLLLEKFIKSKYNLSDIPLKEITHLFVYDFDIFLRTDCLLAHNTVSKYVQRFKKIVTLAKNNGWIHADPFTNHKISFKKADRGYLTQEEIEIIMQKTFSVKKLEQVRDVFIFACFTGLAYIDVKNLQKNNICTSFDGNLWIMTRRQKTDVQVNIPLLDIPKLILEKYKGLPDNMLLPVLSNQKMNDYLKEIADFCGIEKNLTFHKARHSFSTTITLAKGVPIETVSKMLGHTNIKTTQIYARIIDSKISNDMTELAGKLKGMENKLAISQ